MGLGFMITGEFTAEESYFDVLDNTGYKPSSPSVYYTM